MKLSPQYFKHPAFIKLFLFIIWKCHTCIWYILNMSTPGFPFQLPLDTPHIPFQPSLLLPSPFISHNLLCLVNAPSRDTDWSVGLILRRFCEGVVTTVSSRGRQPCHDQKTASHEPLLILLHSCFHSCLSDAQLAQEESELLSLPRNGSVAEYFSDKHQRKILLDGSISK